jgi:hypothetical protein
MKRAIALFVISVVVVVAGLNAGKQKQSRRWPRIRRRQSRRNRSKAAPPSKRNSNRCSAPFAPRRRAVLPFQRLVPEDLRIEQIGRDAAVATFHLRNEQRLARRTIVFTRTARGWRIAHLHASNVSSAHTVGAIRGPARSLFGTARRAKRRADAARAAVASFGRRPVSGCALQSRQLWHRRPVAVIRAGNARAGVRAPRLRIAVAASPGGAGADDTRRSNLRRRGRQLESVRRTSRASAERGRKHVGAGILHSCRKRLLNCLRASARRRDAATGETVRAENLSPVRRGYASRAQLRVPISAYVGGGRVRLSGRASAALSPVSLHFQPYLKSGSGRTFATGHFEPEGDEDRRPASQRCLYERMRERTQV